MARSLAYALLLGALIVAAACEAAAQCPPSQFVAAAAQGDAEQVALCVSEGADVNAGNTDGVTPLMAAAARGRAEVVGTLLDAGAAVDTATDEGLTALMFASAWGRRDVVRTLVGAGANVAHQDAGGRTAIEWARASLYMTGDVAIVVAQYLQSTASAPTAGGGRSGVGADAPDLDALIDRAEAGGA